ncbi:MAG: polyprenyl synthetase family protein [Candidatus Velthaea sp.]
MALASEPLSAFEQSLEGWVRRCPDPSPAAEMVRAHLGFDEGRRRGGKRLRPRILLLVAETEGVRGAEADGAAIAIELLHNYSLVHDDIEDRDEVRHGRPTLWVRFGIPSAIVAGNAMSAMSYLALSESTLLPPDRRVAMERCLQTANFQMCAGQALDIAFEVAPHVTFADYLTMIDGKTAALFSAACELGARAAGASDERALAYAAFGRAYGRAFQIRDDILGTWGTTADTGKPSGADIRRRKWTFPVVWALDGPPSAQRNIVASAYASIAPLDDARAAAVIAALDALGAQAAADAACDGAVAEAATHAARHGLDRAGTLRALFAASSRRNS